MKKILFVLMLLVVTTIDAQTSSSINYKATAFALAKINPNTGYYDWDDWQKSEVTLSFITYQGYRFIRINSEVIQTYMLTECIKQGRDTDNKEITEFNAIDSKNNNCQIRFKVQDTGYHLYIDYSDWAWVYNIIKCQQLYLL